jgi:hypothetical protein
VTLPLPLFRRASRARAFRRTRRSRSGSSC